MPAKNHVILLHFSDLFFTFYFQINCIISIIGMIFYSVVSYCTCKFSCIYIIHPEMQVRYDQIKNRTYKEYMTIPYKHTRTYRNQINNTANNHNINHKWPFRYDQSYFQSYSYQNVVIKYLSPMSHPSRFPFS